jgi:SOS response regulatory protein OraA/RecX
MQVQSSGSSSSSSYCNSTAHNSSECEGAARIEQHLQQAEVIRMVAGAQALNSSRPSAWCKQPLQP